MCYACPCSLAKRMPAFLGAVSEDFSPKGFFYSGPTVVFMSPKESYKAPYEFQTTEVFSLFTFSFWVWYPDRSLRTMKYYIWHTLIANNRAVAHMNIKVMTACTTSYQIKPMHGAWRWGAIGNWWPLRGESVFSKDAAPEILHLFIYTAWVNSWVKNKKEHIRFLEKKY